MAHLLHQFSQFSSIELFKSERKHAKRSSFSLIARNVQPRSPAAEISVETWKKTWRATTFGGKDGKGAQEEVDVRNVHSLLEVFGDRLLELGKPIWRIQARALEAFNRTL